MDRKIKSLVIGLNPVNAIESKDGEITEFWKPTEWTEYNQSSEEKKIWTLWYKQGNYEINGKYVVEIEYEEVQP